MASFPGSRFAGPMFNQNFPRNSFNTNPIGNRFSMQPFQRPPNPAFRPYPPPERYMPGNFQNRPHFSNFPEPMGPPGPRNRPPPPNQVFPMNPAHGFHRPRGSFERPFRPWGHIPPPFGSPRPQLQNRPRAPMPPRHLGDLPLHPSRRGKLKVREFRKLKEDTTLKPFSCDTCDRAFVTENELKDHISQHIQCDHANCTFEAHPKIVALHKKMQHETGYADRINKLKDDAEIQKWREERRRRFPTTENVKKRKAEQAEKEARGEVLETREFGKFKRRRENDGNSLNKGFRRGRGRGFKRSLDRRRHFHPRSQPFTINVDSESDSDSDSHITLRRFLGISSLTNSAKEITDGVKDVEVSSIPQTDITPISDKSESPSQSWCEQNLSESKFDNSVSHPNVQCTDNNSSNLDKDQTPFVLNDDNVNDLANESICKIPVDESASEKQKNMELVEIKELANESICEIPMDESTSEKQKNVEVVEIEDSDVEGPTAVPIVKPVESSLADDQHEMEDKGSDDEGPIALPLVKYVENSLVDEHHEKQNKDSQEIKHSSGVTYAKASDTANTENGHSRNYNKSSRYRRNHYSHVNDQANSQDTVQVARKSSLLEKLLADDIRHERNVILQCIRHIVKNNFFGIENKCLK